MHARQFLSHRHSIHNPLPRNHFQPFSPARVDSPYSRPEHCGNPHSLTDGYNRDYAHQSTALPSLRQSGPRFRIDRVPRFPRRRTGNFHGRSVSMLVRESVHLLVRRPRPRRKTRQPRRHNLDLAPLAIHSPCAFFPRTHSSAQLLTRQCLTTHLVRMRSCKICILSTGYRLPAPDPDPRPQCPPPLPPQPLLPNQPFRHTSASAHGPPTPWMRKWTDLFHDREWNFTKPKRVPDFNRRDLRPSAHGPAKAATQSGWPHAAGRLGESRPRPCRLVRPR
jgi:hypothetical protein